MSGWTLDTDDAYAPSSTLQRSNNHTSGSGSGSGRSDVAEQPRSKPRRAFFDGDSNEEFEKGSSAADVGASDRRKRDSLTLTSSAGVTRRSQRNSHAELVVDDSDDDGAGQEKTATKTAKPQEKETKMKADSAPPARLSVAVKDERGISRGGKSDEIATAEVVRRSSPASTDKAASTTGPRELYMHWLVRDFLQRTYPRGVVDVFDKENPAPGPNDGATSQIQFVHRHLVGVSDATDTSTGLEKLLVVWDRQVHHRHLEPPRSPLTASSSSSTASPSSSSSSASTLATASSKSKSKSSSGSRKKPQLRVTIANDAAPDAAPSTNSEDVDYNRLNHPGHTPKAQQTALLAAVMGEPGSTPKANAAELKALGFEDIDDTEEPVSRTRTQMIPSNAADEDDGDDELSLYAKRKRAALRHTKHVYIGEPGHTPTKEYVFFRETPPRFVTETVEGAEQILRSLGGNPDARRQQIATAKLERFVELQSSDVAKYSLGQRVDNLGAQRNVTGLVSKLYGSRLCGSAGPGTIVIDTWMGNDTAPNAEGEETAEAPRLSGDDEELLEQLLDE